MKIRPRWLGYILWKLGFAIKHIDDLEFEHSYLKFEKGSYKLSVDFIQTKWHYELK